MAENYFVGVGIDGSYAEKGAREFDRASKKVQNSASDMDRKVKRSQESFVGLGNAAYRLRRALGVIGITGFGAALAGATRQALMFDAAMAEVSTLIDDTYDPTNSLTQVVQNLSKEFAQAPTEQARALYQVISAGASSAAEATKTLTAANKLAVGGVTTVSIAADGLTSILNAYGLSAEHAGDVSDAMFEAMKAGKTTIGELSGSVGLLAPIAAQTGVSFQEMLAATAALTKGGLSTAQSMTGLRQALSNVLKPTKQAEEVAERLGIEFNATSLKTKGLAKFMAELTEKAAGNTDAMTNLFGSVEGLNAMMALTSEDGAKALNSIIDSMEGGLGGMIEAAKLAVGEGVEPLKGAITSIIAPTAEAMMQAAQLGIQFDSAALQAMGLEGFLKQLTDEVEGNEEAIIKLFGSVENYNAIMKVAAEDGGEALVDILDELDTKMSATDTAVKKITESTDFQAKQIRAQLTDAYLRLGQTLLTTFGPVIKSINENFDTFVRVVKTGAVAIASIFVAKMIPSIVAATTSMTAGVAQAIRYQAALATMAGGASRASIALATLASAARTATRAFIALGGPVGVILVASSALAAWVGTAKSAEQQAADLAASIGTAADKFRELGEYTQLETLQLGIEGIEDTQQDIADVQEQIRQTNALIEERRSLGGDDSALIRQLEGEKASLETLQMLMDQQIAVWAEQAGAAEGAAAEFANHVAATNGASDAIWNYIVAREKQKEAAAAAAEAERKAAEEADRAAGIVAGLTKQQQIRFEQIRDQIDPMGTALRDYMKDLEIVEVAHSELGDSAFDLAAAKKALRERYEETVKAIEAEKTALSESEKAVKAYEDELRKLTNRFDPVASAQDALNKEIEAFTDLGKKAGKSSEEIAEGVEAIEKAYKDAKLKDIHEQLENLRAGNDKVALATLEHNRSLKELQETEAFTLLTGPEQLELLRLKEEAHQRNIEKIRAECDAAKEAVACQGESAKRLAELWKRGLENIQDAWADAFRNMLTGAGNTFDSIADAFKDMVANMLATWAASGVMNILSGQAFGAGGNSLFSLFASLGGGAGGGAGQSAAANQIGDNIGNAITGSSAFKTLAFASAMFLEGAKQFVLGNVTTGQAFGFSPTFGAGAAAASGGIGALSGTVANAVLGGRGDPTRNAIFSTIGGVIGGIFGNLPGAAIGGAIGSFVDNLIGGAKKLEKAVLELEFQSGSISAEIERVVSKQRSFFRGRKFTTTVENVTDEFSAIEEAVGEFTDGLKTMADDLGWNVQSFLENFTFEGSLDIRGRSQEQVEGMITSYVEDLMLAIGKNFVKSIQGVDQWVSDTLDLFVRGMTTNMEGVTGVIESALTTGGGLTAVIGQLIAKQQAAQAALSSGDEEVVSLAARQLEELMAAIQSVGLMSGLLNKDLSDLAEEIFAEQNMSQVEAYERARVAYQEVLSQYDGSLATLQELAAATQIVTEVQAQLVMQYQMVGRAVQEMFSNTAQSIRESLLNEEELYNLRRTQVDDLVAALNQATDPAEIARISEEINRLTMDAYNLLTEDQQTTMADEFLTFLDEVSGIAQQRTEVGISNVEEDQAAIRNEVSSQLIATAAEIQAQAARDFADAVRDFGDFVREGDGYRLTQGGRGELLV